eukprot:scaffold20825_cov64-Phaeocystis_antarctica.AAC.2
MAVAPTRRRVTNSDPNPNSNHVNALLAPLALDRRKSQQLELDCQLRLAVLTPLALAPLRLLLGDTLAFLLALRSGLPPPAQLVSKLSVHLGREQRRDVELGHIKGRRERQVRHRLEALPRRVALPVAR